jgi:hypothetical protein
MKVSSVRAARLTELRRQLDQEDSRRRLIVSVDGGFTNRTVFRNLQENAVAIVVFARMPSCFSRQQMRLRLVVADGVGMAHHC